MLKKIFEKIMDFFNNRELVMSIIILIISGIFILQLFNLQILEGSTYREQAEKRMVRTETVSASRGEIYDRNGIVLATNKLSYNVELYKVRVEAYEQNDSIKKLIEILESNGDKIYSTFPIKEDLSGFNFSDEEKEIKWKESVNIDTSLNFEQVIDYYIKKYDLEGIEDRTMQIKIIEVKYEGNLNGYSLFNSALIAKDISDKSVAQIEESKSELYGINIVTVPKRYYPNGTVAAHVIGYVSKINSTEYANKKEEGYTLNSIIGKSGIEESFEKYLRGEDGEKKVITDSKGNVSSETYSKDAISGNNVTLTIDYRLQAVAENALLDTINRLKSGEITGEPIEDTNAGAVVVLDVQTGEVLAMASYPTYEINDFVGGISTENWNKIINDETNPMLNRAISGIYSPGSTYKMLVGIAGVKSNGITPDEIYYDPGIYPYGYHPKCWLYTYNGTTHGAINLAGAIKGSCNCYFYEVGRRIGIDEIVSTAKLFGLGQKTGIELSQESSGVIAGENKPDSGWYLGDTLSAAIGQSYNAYTPIQLANYIATIANGGNLNKVSIIKKVEKSDGEEISLRELIEYSKKFTGVDFEAKNIGLDADLINRVKEGMLSVTSETGGTASSIFYGSSIQVGGKTGTSQVTTGSNNGIFVGFAPYDNPKIAVVAIIEHGEEGLYTAHVVRAITDEYFNMTSEDKENEKVQNIVESSVNF
ncbi:MAG: penicillin-binding protein 2 [Clostridia bacterium]|nr:penicillin-binding protein 2 [Clostridia bacterium]